MNMLPMQQTPREVEGFSPWKMALTCFNNLRICFAGVRFFPLSHLRYLFRYCILCAKNRFLWNVDTCAIMWTLCPWYRHDTQGVELAKSGRATCKKCSAGTWESQSNNAWVTHGLCRKRSWRASWGTKTVDQQNLNRYHFTRDKKDWPSPYVRFSQL